MNCECCDCEAATLYDTRQKSERYVCKKCLFDFCKFEMACDGCGDVIESTDSCYVWQDNYYCESCLPLVVPTKKDTELEMWSLMG